MRTLRQKTSRAFTLPELLTSVGCGVIILAAILVAGVSLQRSYAALETYSTSAADQLRVLDYIAMDCRRATAATVGSVTVNGVTESQLVLTLPAYYKDSTSSTSTFDTPTLGGGKLQFGTVSGGVITPNSDIVKVYYQQSGANFTREVKVTDSTGATTRSDVTTAIAKNVSNFTANPIDLTNSVSCSIMFFPTFQKNTGTGKWWSGQYSPNDHAPDNGVGTNGDWYVINNTATDATTVGDVFYKSAGFFSRVENVKATTVAIQTFLRNASARQ